jgi:hypothetical protein
MSYDAERAALNIATPELRSTISLYMTRRAFRKSGYRFCDQNTRHFFPDAFSDG